MSINRNFFITSGMFLSMLVGAGGMYLFTLNSCSPNAAITAKTVDSNEKFVPQPLATPAPLPVTEAGSIEKLIVGLRKRLEQNPGDVKGWVLLAKSYQFLGESQKAVAAAQQAKALGYSDEILTEVQQNTAPPLNPHHTGAIFNDEYLDPDASGETQATNN